MEDEGGTHMRSVRKNLVFGLGALLLIGLNERPSAAQWQEQNVQPVCDPAATEAAVDHCISDIMTRTGTPAAQVAVVIDGVLAYEQGYGIRHRVNGGVVDADTIFRSGSIAKMMTAATIMQQVEEGKVWLDDSLAVHVPEYQVPGPWPARLIKVRHLLTHTSGVPDGTGPADLVGDDALYRWAALEHPRLYAPPGSFFNYTNLGYNLLGLVVEKGAGLPFDAYLKTRLWQPAGMFATSHDPAGVEAGGNFAYGYWVNPTSEREEAVAPSDYFIWVDTPNGEAFTTAGDLARWALLMLDDGSDLLSPESVAAMQQPLLPMLGFADTYYGFGVMSKTRGDVQLKGHGGGVPGYQAALWWAPEHDFAVAVMVNSWSYSVSEAVGCIVDTVLDPVPVASPPEIDAPETWARWQGRYHAFDMDGEPLILDVALLGSQLFLTLIDVSGEEPPMVIPVRHVHKDTFGADLDGDGVQDIDATFVDADHMVPRRQWIVNRLFVGQRQSFTHDLDLN
jgi:CubicO group peptidase (beta-lactamase class C family)